MRAIFELKNVGYQYTDTRKALSNINLSVPEGEILSIVGSNGSGKSTLLHLMCGLIYPMEGSIAYKGIEFQEKSFKKAAFNREFRSSIGFVFQNSDAQLFCPTVLDELIFGPLQLGYPKNLAIERADEVVRMLHLEAYTDRPSYMLSSGEKKRVAIGAVLTTNPEVLIFDEPMSGLDPKTRSFIIDLIFELSQVGKTIIVATHHLDLVDYLKSRVVVLSERHTIEKTGSSDEILSDTDLLINANLIAEYSHRHNGTVHKHLSLGFLSHRHGGKS
ncbi:MAG: ABC transporter ATP-binding protein [Saprospirales bacterium]|nr:ABC transporter ATP-binding protein [Saprospirales bacterium]MBK8492397.1 ABC transporter ATP-binding protein [Saprospirales bacterium]